MYVCSYTVNNAEGKALWHSYMHKFLRHLQICKDLYGHFMHTLHIDVVCFLLAKRLAVQNFKICIRIFKYSPSMYSLEPYLDFNI